ncbi:MAG: hypothetical protein HZB81_01140 [Deltaproteobacteria bacterium]|nr:hypothetical protein [Deltaproteobacteria bacterium]
MLPIPLSSMAQKPKRTPAAKRPASPRVKNKDGTIIVPVQAMAAPWYFQRRNFILIIIGAILLLVLVLQWLGNKEPETTKTAQQISKPIQPKPEAVYQETQKADIIPKIISIKLSPSSPVKGDTIKAEVLTAGEGATVSYEWRKNGEPLNAAGDALSSDFKKGDAISLTVVPSDGKQKGAPATVVTHIFNSAPVITSTIKDSKFSDNVFTYQVKAEDPDDDILTYSLLGWPEGMAIDSKTGFIKWAAPAGFKGKANVMLSVNDGAGGEAKQIFSIQINQRNQVSVVP